MRLVTAFILCVFAAAASAAERPKAAPGFKWHSYRDLYCDIQVPDGWFESRRSAGLTQAVLLSPDKIGEGSGIDTGFTMNTVKCHTQQEWKEAMELAGRMMSDYRKATEKPVESRVEDTPDMLFMVVEGVRYVPDSPHPEKKYYVRAVVRAFPKFATIYMYSFGAPAEEWDEAWKKGTVFFNPVWFTLKK